MFLKASCPVNLEAPECENRTQDFGYLELKKYIIVGSVIVILVAVVATYFAIKSDNVASFEGLFSGGSGKKKRMLLNLQQKIESGIKSDIKRPGKTFTTPSKKIKRGTDEAFNNLFY